MNPFEQARWIWCHRHPKPDEYGEFYSSFVYEKGKVCLSLSADSNYAVYCNGTLCAFGQYPDFPHDKVYDTIDISSFCQKGENHLAILVWYYGEAHLTYYTGNAALIFALTCDGALLCASNTHTPSRLSPSYIPHRRKYITSQLGFYK